MLGGDAKDPVSAKEGLDQKNPMKEESTSPRHDHQPNHGEGKGAFGAEERDPHGWALKKLLCYEMIN